MSLITLILLSLNQLFAGSILTTLSHYDAVKAIKRSPLVIVTVASNAKVHGHHLPMNTDVIIAERLAKDLSDQTDAAIFPNITVGWYPQFANFKLVNHSSESAQKIIRETVEGLIESGANRILVLNFDDEHSAGLPIMTVMLELKQKHQTPMLLLSWYDFVNDGVQQIFSSRLGHADELETSLILHLDGALVDKTKLRNVVFDVPELQLPGFKPIIINSKKIPGQLGNSSQATTEKGQRAYTQILTNIKKAVADLSLIPLQKN